jgi:hypothetical protein
MALYAGVTVGIFVVCVLAFQSDVQPWAGLGALVGFVTFCIFWLIVIGWLAVAARTARDHQLPPAPVPLPDKNAAMMEDFKNQKALGDARLATPDEVHAALARKEAPPQPRRFTD